MKYKHIGFLKQGLGTIYFILDRDLQRVNIEAECERLLMETEIAHYASKRIVSEAKPRHDNQLR